MTYFSLHFDNVIVTLLLILIPALLTEPLGIHGLCEAGVLPANISMHKMSICSLLSKFSSKPHLSFAWSERWKRTQSYIHSYVSECAHSGKTKPPKRL